MYIASYPVRNESPPFLNAQFFNTCKFNSTERKRQRMRGNWWLDPLLDRESNLWSSQGTLKFINLTIEILVIWRVYFRMNIYVQSHFTKNTSALCPIYEIICTVKKLASFEAIKGSQSLLWNEKYCILNKYKIRYIMKMQGLLLRK